MGCRSRPKVEANVKRFDTIGAARARSGSFPAPQDHHPRHDPQQWREATEDEEHPPAIDGDQSNARGIDQRLSEPDADEVAGIDQPPLGVGEPIGNGARARRKRDRLADTHRDPEEHDRGDIAKRAGQRAGNRPDPKTTGVGAAYAEAVHNPARRHLHEAVAPRKGRQDEAHRLRIDRKVSHHERSGDRERAALRIAERHPAHEQCDETPAARDAADVDGGDAAGCWHHQFLVGRDSNNRNGDDAQAEKWKPPGDVTTVRSGWRK